MNDDAGGSAEDAIVGLQYELTAMMREATGLHEPIASLMAERLLQVLRRRFGGGDLYIPARDRAERDKAIRAEFNGRNLNDLCRRYEISRTRVYEIVGKNNCPVSP